MGSGSKTRRLPDDLAHWCLIESLTQLAARYGVSTSTVERMMKRMPVEVRIARRARTYSLQMAGLTRKAAPRVIPQPPPFELNEPLMPNWRCMNDEAYASAVRAATVRLGEMSVALLARRAVAA